MTDESLQLMYALMQPTRQKIIRTLRNSNEPLYIKQIAEKIVESETKQRTLTHVTQ